MANEENIELQDLSSDEILEKGKGFFEENQNIIYGVAGAAIVITLGIFAYFQMYLAPRTQKGYEAIYKADQMLERDSFALALNGKNIPGQAGNFDGYTDVIEKYSGSPAANMAHYKAGVACLQLGKPELAIKFLQGFSGSEELQTQAYNLMGDAASSMGKFDEALGYYKKAANYTEIVSLKLYALYKVAKLYEHQNNLEDAKKYYQKIIDKDLAIAQSLGVEKDLIRLTQ